MKLMKESEQKLLKEMEKVHDRLPKWILGPILAGMFVVFAYYTAGLFVLLLISGIIAYLLSSIISRIEYYGIRRSVAVAALYVAAFIILIGADILLMPFLQQETRNFTERLPEITQQTEEAFRDLRGYPAAEEMIEKVLEGIASPSLLLGRMLNVTEIFNQAASLAFAIVLIPFFVFFMLKDWPELLKKVMNRVPAAYVETTVAALSEINILAGHYLRGLAIDCFAVGSMVSLGLWMLGVSYPVTLGIITGAANVIPYVGPVVSCIAACLIAFIQFKSPAAILNVALLYMGVRLLDDFLVQPLTIGRSVRLHPVILIISIIAGQKLFGILGMVLAVPAVTVLQKVVVIFMEGRSTWSGMPEAPKHSNEIIV